MNPNITEGLTKEQLQNFDVDSIEKIIKNFEKTKELNSFDLDGNDRLTLEEIEINNKLKGTSNIIENLYSLLKKVKSTNKKEKSWKEELFGDNETISSKDIEKYNKDEAIKVLNYLNNNYSNYSDAFSKTAEEITENLSSTDSLDDIDTKAEVNIFQQKLIKKIMGTDEGFSSEYLEGYNNKKGNFIVDTGNFMNNIKKTNISDINSHVLTNFFKLLTNGYRINILELKALFGETKLADLKEYWNSDKSNNIAKRYLIENGLGYIVEMMDTDLDYYASLSKKELKEKLQIIKNKDEKLRINNYILNIQIDEKLNILNNLGINKNELNKIKNKYFIDNNTNELDKSTILYNYNTELSDEILLKLEKKEGTGKKLLNEIGIHIKKDSDDVDNSYYDITFEELLNKLQKEKNINKVLLIIKELYTSEISFLKGDIDLIDISLIDEYLNKISSNPNNKLKQINNIIANLDLFRSQGLCPKPETVINLKKATIQNETLQNRIKESIDNLYPNGENMGDKLIKKINEKLNKAKKGKGYCSIEIIAIIKEFDKENAKYRKNPNKTLEINNIKKIVGGVMQDKVEQINKEVRGLLVKAGQLIAIQNTGLNKYSNLKSVLGSNQPNNNYSRDANLKLRTLSIEEINNLPKLTKEEKDFLIQKKSELKSADKAQKNIYSLSNKEFESIIKGINEGKDPFEIKKEIEKNRKKDSESKEIENTKIENTNNSLSSFNTNKDNYTQTSNGYTLEVNGTKIKGISEEEKKLTLGNPEATENLITLYKTLIEDLKLPYIWKYRNQISNAIGSTNGVNNNDNSLSSNELQIFLNSVLKSVGKKEIKQQNSIKQYTNLFKLENNYQVVGNGYKNDTNKIGNSTIEEDFMKKYVTGFSKFQSSIFKQNI